MGSLVCQELCNLIVFTLFLVKLLPRRSVSLSYADVPDNLNTEWVDMIFVLSKHSMAVSCYLPRSSSAGLLRSTFVSPSVVLADSPLGVHGKADVNAPLKFGVGTVEHVHSIKALHLHNHCNTTLRNPLKLKISLISTATLYHLDKLH